MLTMEVVWQADIKRPVAKYPAQSKAVFCSYNNTVTDLYIIVLSVT